MKSTTVSGCYEITHKSFLNSTVESTSFEKLLRISDKCFFLNILTVLFPSNISLQFNFWSSVWVHHSRTFSNEINDIEEETRNDWLSGFEVHASVGEKPYLNRPLEKLAISSYQNLLRKNMSHSINQKILFSAQSKFYWWSET